MSNLTFNSRSSSYSHQEMFFINGSVRLVPTFTEFVRFLVEQPPQEYDPHWMPISLLCGVCYINYTAVVHIETFLPDMKYIMRLAGVLFLVMYYDTWAVLLFRGWCRV